jgi:hypothetical protein
VASFKKIFVLTALACAALVPFRMRAATLLTETFAGGLNGWTNGLDATKWVVTNEAARVAFTFGLVPKSASLEAGFTASGGGFCGDYAAAGVEGIGFSLVAEDLKPSVLKLEVTSGTNIFFQDLQPKLLMAGMTNNIFCPLIGPGIERWSGTSAEALPESLFGITRIAIRITTSGTAAQAFRLDDVFLDRLPVAVLAESGSNHSPLITWGGLRTGTLYRIEQAAALEADWIAETYFTATNSVMTRVCTATPPICVRLVIP